MSPSTTGSTSPSLSSHSAPDLPFSPGSRGPRSANATKPSRLPSAMSLSADDHGGATKPDCANAPFGGCSSKNPSAAIRQPSFGTLQAHLSSQYRHFMTQEQQLDILRGLTTAGHHRRQSNARSAPHTGVHDVSVTARRTPPSVSDRRSGYPRVFASDQVAVSQGSMRSRPRRVKSSVLRVARAAR